MLCWCWCYSCSWWRFRKWLTNYFVFISLTFNLKYKFSLNRKLKRLSRQHLSLFFMSHHDARYKFQAISPIMTHSNPYNADTQQLTHKQDWHISAHTKIILARSITTTNNTDLEYLTHKWYWQTVSHTQKTDRQYLIQKLYWHTASCTQRILTHNISHTNNSYTQ